MTMAVNPEAPPAATLLVDNVGGWTVWTPPGYNQPDIFDLEGALRWIRARINPAPTFGVWLGVCDNSSAIRQQITIAARKPKATGKGDVIGALLFRGPFDRAFSTFEAHARML